MTLAYEGKDVAQTNVSLLSVSYATSADRIEILYSMLKPKKIFEHYLILQGIADKLSRFPTITEWCDNTGFTRVYSQHIFKDFELEGYVEKKGSKWEFGKIQPYQAKESLELICGYCVENDILNEGDITDKEMGEAFIKFLEHIKSKY